MRRRLHRCIIATTLVVLATACVPSGIRATLPALSPVEPTYAGLWRRWLPWWYTLYSILPGETEVDCRAPSTWRVADPARDIELVACMPVPAAQLSRLADTAGAAATSVEAAFAGRVHVSRIRIRMVPPRSRFLDRDSTYLRQAGIRFGFTTPYALADAEASRRRIVRAEAHELFVFGSVSRSAFDLGAQSDPRTLVANREARRSAAGNLQASRRLAAIAGPDETISSAAEQARLAALCASLAP